MTWRASAAAAVSAAAFAVLLAVVLTRTEQTSSSASSAGLDSALPSQHRGRGHLFAATHRLQQPRQLRMRTRTIDTRLDPGISLREDVSLSGVDAARDSDLADHVPHTLVVQFEPRAGTSVRARVATIAGRPVGSYLPHHAHLVYADMAAARAIRRVPGVVWVAVLAPVDKVAPELAQHVDATALTAAMDHYPPYPGKAKDVLAGMPTALPTPRARPWYTLEISLTDAAVGAADVAATLQAALDPPGSVVAVTPQRVLAARVGRDALEDFVAEVAAHPGVHWVAERAVFTTMNREARVLTQTGERDRTVSRTETARLRGQGQIVGVGDTGIDMRNCMFHDPHQLVPFTPDPIPVFGQHRKLAGYWTFMDDVDDAEVGHGTHVAGSVAGHSLAAPPHPDQDLAKFLRLFDGMASEASLAFTDIGCSSPGGCACVLPQCVCSEYVPGRNDTCAPGSLGLPASLGDDYFSWTRQMGARVHSNSWGSASPAYDAASADVDAFVLANPDFLPVFAAGNAGRDGFYTVGSPGNAKNVLTVGAAQSSFHGIADALRFANYSGVVHAVRERGIASVCDSCSQGCGNSTLCDWWRNFDENVCCMAELTQPLCCREFINATHHADPSHFDSGNMAAFSSRGPTMDGRIKPDVVAPGESITSAASHGNETSGQVCGAAGATAAGSLKSMRGTSMATPLTAGSVAIIRQYLEQGFYPSGRPQHKHAISPSAALLKALAIHSGRPLRGALDQDAHGHWLDLDGGVLSRWPSATPSMVQGFGHITLDDVLPTTAADSPMQVMLRDQSHGVNDDEAYTLCVRVTNTSLPLKVTLVWTDAPATPGAAVDLVNDLDMEVCEGEHNFFGNRLSTQGPSGQQLPIFDHVNNVEQVIVPQPRARLYSITLRGTSVPIPPQPYALVVSAAGFDRPDACSACPHEPGVTLTVSEAVGISIAMFVGGVAFSLLVLYALRRLNVAGASNAAPYQGIPSL